MRGPSSAVVALALVGVCAVVPAMGAGCTPDASEPDDACRTSVAVVAGGEMQHRNFCDDATDWVTFNACAGRTYSIATANLGAQADTVLDLYDRDCATLLASDDDGGGGGASEIASWIAPADGSYHILVSEKDATSGDGRDYDLHLTGDTSPCSTWARDDSPLDTTIDRRFYQASLAPDGGTLLAGWTDLGDGEGDQMWLVRLGPDGHPAWQRTFDAGRYVFGYGSAAAADGSILVAGTYYDPQTFASYGVVAKLDPSGTTLWETQVGAGDEDLYALRATDDGGAIAVGQHDTQGGADGWIVRLSSSGGVLWSRTYGGSGFDAFYDLAPTPDGGFVVAGETGSYGAGDADGWTLKIDGSGAPVWQAAYGGTLRDVLWTVSTAPDGSAIFGGVYGDSASTSLGWALATDPSGALRWDRTIHILPGMNYAFAVGATRDGGAAVSGKVDPATGSANFLWVARLGETGATFWQETYDGVSDAGSVFETPDGGLTLAASPSDETSARVLHMEADGRIDSCAALRSTSATVAPIVATRTVTSVAPGDVTETPIDPALPSAAHAGPEADYCPCVVPAYVGTLYANKIPGGVALGWTQAGTETFDVVRGDLGTLRETGGDFAQALDAVPDPAQNACVANDDPDTFFDDYLCCLEADAGWFYLLRPTTLCPGTYDEGVPSQPVSRDPGIEAATSACP